MTKNTLSPVSVFRGSGLAGAWLSLTLLITTPVGAVTVEEATTGAAAVATLAAKCNPRQARAYEQQAMADLESMLRGLPAAERSYAMDAAGMKVKAFAISSQALSCAESEKFRQMARTWGFARFVAE